MRTSAAALELDFTEPSITAAKAVADTLARNGSLQRDTLLWVMEQAYGGSSADGRWSLRDAYDMLELAQVSRLSIGRIGQQQRHCQDGDGQRQILCERASARSEPNGGGCRKSGHSDCPFCELLDALPKTINLAVCASADVSQSTVMVGADAAGACVPRAGGGAGVVGMAGARPCRIAGTTTVDEA